MNQPTSCVFCAALVADAAAHQEWHDRLDGALGKLLVAQDHTLPAPTDAIEHAAHLRRAMAMAEMKRKDLADALGVPERTIVNWTSRSIPTLPSALHRERLRQILPGYGG